MVTEFTYYNKKQFILLLSVSICFQHVFSPWRHRINAKMLRITRSPLDSFITNIMFFHLQPHLCFAEYLGEKLSLNLFSDDSCHTNSLFWKWFFETLSVNLFIVYHVCSSEKGSIKGKLGLGQLLFCILMSCFIV